MINIDQVMKAVGIYIHIPFCLKKCSYCDFYSLAVRDKHLLDRYCQAVTEEIRRTALQHHELEIKTIFLGGGTPSLLSGRQLGRILQAIKANFSVQPDVEITVEANPATIDPDKIEEYLAVGVNRISLGAQSFRERELAILGRMHNKQDIFQAVKIIKQCGLKNFNLDLIYGIPGQSVQEWADNLQIALALEPAHISAYLLQLEPQTIMAKQAAQKLIMLAGEETEAAMYDTLIDLLPVSGFKHYEISNFTLPAYECRHNLIYWQSHNYIGFGAGAVSYLSNCRYINKPALHNYLAALHAGQMPPTELLEEMSLREQIADAVILGLRLIRGINIEEIDQRFGIDFLNEYNQEINDNLEKGLLTLHNGQLFLTRRGYFLANQVLCHFVA